MRKPPILAQSLHGAVRRASEAPTPGHWIAVALFGVASMTYPPLRLIIGSVTTSAWCIGAGAAMVFLPLVIVGHEILIVGVSCGVAAIWFLAHRQGQLNGQLSILKPK